MNEEHAVTCNQHDCDGIGVYRFTWPGRDEAAICEEHAPQLRAIANAMGLHLQMIPLSIVDFRSALPSEEDASP